MTIPAQSAVWDEGRNTSRERRPSPTALRDLLVSLAAFRKASPAHVQWISEGAPNLTEEEHVRRFGEPYNRGGRRRG